MRNASRPRVVFLLACCALAVAAARGQPSPVFISPGPGLNAPFLQDDFVDDYGHRQITYGWTWDGLSGSTSTGLARYRPSYEGQNSTPAAMPTDQDWVLALSYKHTGPYRSDQAWITKAHEASLDHRLVSLFNDGDNSYSLRAGNAAGGWSTIVSGLTLDTSSLSRFTIHYKADVQKLDAYLNSNLIAHDFTVGHGDYALDFLQLQPLGGGGTESFSQIRIGQRLTRDGDFGKNWVHTHPFTTMALTLRDSLFDINEYAGANLSTTLAWKTQPATLQASARAHMPWMQRLAALDGPTPQFQTTVNQLLANYPGGLGFFINDEPTTTQDMIATGQAMDWIRMNHGDQLVTTAIGGADDFAAHVDQHLALVRPDVLMFDYYPFGPPGVEDPNGVTTLYRRLSVIRDKALQANLPYWSFIQAYDSVTPYISESDLRMQVFTALAHGFTGLAYFTYDPPNDESRTFLDLSGTPTLIYQYAAKADAEVARLGKSLRLLKSVDLGFVPAGSLPSGLSRWDPGDGPYITSISADNPGLVNNGQAGDLLVGYFVPDVAGQPPGDPDAIHFMVVNLLRAHGASAEQAQQRVRIDFDFGDSGIDSLLRLSRLTGAPQRVGLVHDGGSLYHLDLTLDGGTADLFKFRGDFAGIPGGDANLDGAVDVIDLGILATHWQETSAAWTAGDFNLDGNVDVIDLGILATHWQVQGGNPRGAESLDQALERLGLPGPRVPEPACLAGWALAWSLGTARRWKRIIRFAGAASWVSARS